jgi:TRAP-type C4-dicarboxylate transport system permease small subunit
MEKTKDLTTARSIALNSVYHVVRRIAVVFLIIQIIVVSYVVFGRFVLNKTPRWGEEFSLLCMVWFSLLSASMAEFNQSHIGVKLNKFFLPPLGVHIVYIVNYVIKVGISIFMIYAGFVLAYSSRRGILPGMDISIFWLYLSIPVSGLFLLFVLLLRMKEVFKW